MLIANNLQHRKVQILRVYTSGHHAHDKGNTDRLQLSKDKRAAIAAIYLI